MCLHYAVSPVGSSAAQAMSDTPRYPATLPSEDYRPRVDGFYGSIPRSHRRHAALDSRDRVKLPPLPDKLPQLQRASSSFSGSRPELPPPGGLTKRHDFDLRNWTPTTRPSRSGGRISPTAAISDDRFEAKDLYSNGALRERMPRHSSAMSSRGSWLPPPDSSYATDPRLPPLSDREHYPADRVSYAPYDSSPPGYYQHAQMYRSHRPHVSPSSLYRLPPPSHRAMYRPQTTTPYDPHVYGSHSYGGLEPYDSSYVCHHRVRSSPPGPGPGPPRATAELPALGSDPDQKEPARRWSTHVSSSSAPTTTSHPPESQQSSPEHSMKRKSSSSESEEAPRSRPSPKLSKRRPSGRSSTSDNLVCQGCSATSTPEWRKGPLGPRTLCNACGLLYAKISRKQECELVATAVASGQDADAARAFIQADMGNTSRKNELLEALRTEVRTIAASKQQRQNGSVGVKPPSERTSRVSGKPTASIPA